MERIWLRVNDENTSWMSEPEVLFLYNKRASSLASLIKPNAMAKYNFPSKPRAPEKEK